jgi:hypothetical protein
VLLLLRDLPNFYIKFCQVLLFLNRLAYIRSAKIQNLMKKHFVLFTFLCLALATKAQQVQWIKPIIATDTPSPVPQTLYVDDRNITYVISNLTDTGIFGKNTLIADNTHTMVVISRYDSAGNNLPLIVIKRDSLLLTAHAMATDKDGNIYLAGSFVDSINKQDYVLLKCDSTGKIIRSISSGGLHNSGQGISLDKNNNIYLTGYIGENGDSFKIDTFFFKAQYHWNSFITKFNPVGKILWAKFFHATLDRMAHVHGNLVGNNGLIYSTGHFSQKAMIDTFQIARGAGTCHLMGLDSADGRVRFLSRDTTYSTEKYYLYQDKKGDIFTAGLFGFTTARFNENGIMQTYFDSVFVKHTATGVNSECEVLSAYFKSSNSKYPTLLFTDQFGKHLNKIIFDLPHAEIERIIPDKNNDFMLFGKWVDTFAYKGDTFYRRGHVGPYKNVGQFVAKVKAVNYSGIEPQNHIPNNLFSLFPNPNNGTFALKINEKLSSSLKLDIYDMLGRCMYSDVYNGQIKHIDIALQGLNSGQYILHFQTDVTSGSRKFVIP